jgi:hypothetical protein
MGSSPRNNRLQKCRERLRTRLKVVRPFPKPCTRGSYVHQNNDICKRLGVTSVEKKIVQHHFGHIQWKPSEAPILSRVMSQTANGKRSRGRPNFTREESVKRDLKDYSITKELALHRSKWKLAIHVSEP